MPYRSGVSELVFDVYGRFRVRVARRAGGWVAQLVASDGKRRPLPDVVVPPEATPEEIVAALEAVFHEVGRPGGRIRIVER